MSRSNQLEQEILVVDDSSSSLNYLSSILSDSGYRVRTASCAHLALALLEGEAPDLILMDVEMPGLNGFELCRLLKSDGRHTDVPVLFISSLTQTAIKVEGFEAGGLDFITKPFEPREVLARVGTHLRLRELTERLEQTVRQRTEELLVANLKLRREVAERDRAEQEIRSNWLLLQSVLDNSTAVIYVKSPEGHYLLINRRFEELFGVTRGWVAGKTDYDIFPKERADAFRDFDLRVLSTGMPLQSEELAPHDNGLHCYLSTKAPLVDQTGRIHGICGISTDITGIKRAEEEHITHLRFLESLEQVDRAIRQADCLDAMMTDVLDTALSLFSGDRAWLLYPCDPETSSWRVPMERTTAGYPGALVMGVDIPASPEVCEVFRDSLDSADPVVYDPRSGRPLPPEVASRFSVRSQIMMAVYPKHGKPWLFGMHQCSHARVWSEQDVNLFKEIGRRIADGLSSLLFLRELQESGKELERRVIDRTSRLEEANSELTLLARQLESAYHELKSAHVRVLQQEKMASIGLLAAGVAHEINNPIGFIISNLNSLDKYARKIADFVAMQCEKVEECAARGDAQCERAIKELQEKKRAMKIDYVLDDLSKLVGESLEGAERVAKIVRNLKTFSRVEALDVRSAADLNAGLESTINIIWNELKYKAVVKKEYGSLPSIECNLGQLNQVFMNILMNAGQAIEKQGTITVRTWGDQGMVYVEISDTGTGIPADRMPRIFEPFFTTKEVGEGTGLGLSIAYDIVKKHNGEITVASEAGKGTTFTIAIPVAT